MRLCVLAVALALAPLACAPERVRDFDAGRLGRVRVFEPSDGRAALVFLFSDAPGWSPTLDEAALEIVREGAAVVGVDLRRYLAGLAASSEGCHYVVAELEDLSHRLERELGYERYRSPILAGVGAGGTLAYAALAQSPAATIAGAVSVDPSPTLGTRVPLCPGAPTAPAQGGGFAYGPKTGLQGWWRVASARPLPDSLASLALPSGGSPPSDAVPEQRLLALVRTTLDASGARGDAELGDLPLVELAAASPGVQMAVIYSGDGGWRDLDKQIGEFLAEHGTPVVGVDSLRYFWREKTPEEVARDLSRILRHYGERWGTREVILVGYSFGAGVLPFAVNRLPASDRAAIALVSLLGLGPRAPFEIRVSGWLGASPSDYERLVLPELVRLDLSRVQCFYGEEERDTLCRVRALAAAEIVPTAGGHHFDGDYAALANRILVGAERRVRAAPGGA